MAAIVGAAGMASSLAAAKAGKRILLANKESLVLAGDLFMVDISIRYYIFHIKPHYFKKKYFKAISGQIFMTFISRHA